jgi:hypothetical protein
MREVKVTHLICVFWLLISTGCGADHPKPNQEQPLTSPSGKYVLTVPIETAQDGHRYWRVTIADASRHVLFKDDSRFVGNLNVYWCWDDRDRVWLTNSDDGSIHFWEADEQNRWRRYQWDEHNPNCLFPPTRLLRK